MTETATLPRPEALLGQTKTVTEKRGGDFPAVVKFTEDLQRIVGEYLGETTFPTPDGKTARGHLWKLAAASEGVKFILGKKEVPVFVGAIVSVSGAVLDRAFKPEDK